MHRPSVFADLSDKVACVTGASSGIGQAIAVELALGGADVIVHYGQNRTGAEETALKIRSLGRHAELVARDLREADLQDFAKQVWNISGKVDLWVNNAGADILTGTGTSLSYSEKLQRLWSVDVVACMSLSRAIGAMMKQAGTGAILNIGWDQADRGMEGDSAELFSAVKNAVMGFTRSLALNLAPEVRVNCISPGWIRTSWGESAKDSWQERVLKETPLKRWGTPEDIARLARFLASEEANYITGQVINANGGAVR